MVWIIERNYNIFKKIFEIENFTSNAEENIKHDAHARVIKYNIGFNYYNICHKLVVNQIKKHNKEIMNIKVDFANLIRNINFFRHKNTSAYLK